MDINDKEDMTMETKCIVDGCGKAAEFASGRCWFHEARHNRFPDEKNPPVLIARTERGL